MDHVRQRMNEHNKNRQKKLIIGIVALIIVIAGAVLIERAISLHVEEVTIKKASITDEKATFIPVKSMKTNIIAVEVDDDYRLAFDICSGCYFEAGKKSGFENNADNTGLVCKRCRGEISYEEMGFGEDIMPYPIYINEIIETEDSFVLTKEYLEKHKEKFDKVNQGPNANSYRENPSK